MNDIISLENLTICYERHPAVHHVSGSFTTGVTTAIIGANGAGKSTLLQAIMGIIPVQSGKIIYKIKPYNIAYLPQRVDIDTDFPINVIETVNLGHWRKLGIFKQLNDDHFQISLKALEQVGLDGFAQRTLNSLSIGQLQRVLFARIIVQNCQIILLDEPFSAIDNKTTDDLLNIIKLWHQENRTIIAVLHNFTQVKEHFDEVLLLAREKIAWGRISTVMTTDNLQKAKNMAENWDENAQVCEI
jgi:zinc/manganese transport system ATP-binding protein